ncbi:MAG: nicotinate-nucleotide adenylyltransferase [Deltaproteobacteria bacterium]|nr:nicotinate-nucleotide adenylyltransferase [Deltaproteobacteria bacterium]
MRVGIFGGTFNPVHIGHLITAETLHQDFALDRILFVPSARPPHKPSPGLIGTEHRTAMVRLAIAGNPAFELSTVEIDRQGTSYSVQTVEALRHSLGEGGELYFILGIDAFLDLATWHRPERLLRLCHFIVNSRPGFSFAEASRVLAGTFGISSNEGVSQAALPGGHTLFFAEVPLLAISSTKIRTALAGGRSVKYLLPEPVESYILLHHLYIQSQ